jgi:hypothetical protein
VFLASEGKVQKAAAAQIPAELGTFKSLNVRRRIPFAASQFCINLPCGLHATAPPKPTMRNSWFAPNISQLKNKDFTPETDIDIALHPTPHHIS